MDDAKAIKAKAAEDALLDAIRTLATAVAGGVYASPEEDDQAASAARTLIDALVTLRSTYGA